MRINTILILSIFHSFFCFSQTADFSKSHFTVNASSNFYYRQLGGYFTKLKAPDYKESQSEGFHGPYYTFKDTHRKDGLYVSAGLDFLYNYKRDGVFGISIGLAYNYVKDFYTYSYYNRSSIGYSITDRQATGSGELTNRLARFVFSLNWTSKKNFTFYIRPLNYEIRIIENKSKATYLEYDVVLKSKPSSYGASGRPYYEDSLKTLSKQFEAPILVVRTFSFCFPTTIGIEQKFKCKNMYLNAGLSIGGSILELYYVPRAYIGFCLGEFK
jgi:hypothetical protein